MTKQASLRRSHIANTVNGLSKYKIQHIPVSSNSTLPSRNILPMSSATASTASTSGQQKCYSTVVLKEPVVVGMERKEKPGGSGAVTRQVSMPPPSKVCKSRFALDVTPNWLSQQLLTRKLDKKGIVSKDAGSVRKSVETKRVGIVKLLHEGTTGVAKQDCTVTCMAEVNASSPCSAGNNSATPRTGGAGNISSTPSTGSTEEKSKSRRKANPSTDYVQLVTKPNIEINHT